MEKFSGHRKFTKPDNHVKIIDAIANYTYFENISVYAKSIPKGILQKADTKQIRALAAKITSIEFHCCNNDVLLGSIEDILSAVDEYIMLQIKSNTISEAFRIIKEASILATAQYKKYNVKKVTNMDTCIHATAYSKDNVYLISLPVFIELFGHKYNFSIRQLMSLRSDIWKEIAVRLRDNARELELKHYSLTKLAGLGKVKTTHIVELIQLFDTNGIITERSSLNKLEEVLMVLFGYNKAQLQKARYDLKEKENPVKNFEQMVENTISIHNRKINSKKAKKSD